VNLYEAMVDPELFGRTFGGPTFENWRAVAKMLDGLPLSERELALYRDLTQRHQPPTAPCSEVYLIKPRRAGGTLFAAAVGLHAALEDYRDRLGPGEVATVGMIAADRKQARQLMNYVKGLISDSAIISAEVKGETAESITFSHRTQLEVHVTSFRSTRGYSYAAVIMDEMAFYRDDFSAAPDIELVRAVRPGLANLKGRLLGLSSPHSRRGHLYVMHQAHFGKPSDVLVLKGTHGQLNPTIDPKVVERAMAEDPEAARAEWFGEFRSDISQWLADELIDCAVEAGRSKRGSARPAHAFTDVSGGRHDASALALAHSEQQGSRPSTVILDHLECVPAPHEPHAVIERFAETLKRHHLSKVTGDRYAGGFVEDAFRKLGITYLSSELDKSTIYNEALPLFAERRAVLLDDKRLLTELRLLERRPRAGGRADAVDHPPRGHDDAANAACGALALAAKGLDAATMWARLAMTSAEFEQELNPQ